MPVRTAGQTHQVLLQTSHPTHKHLCACTYNTNMYVNTWFHASVGNLQNSQVGEF